MNRITKNIIRNHLYYDWWKYIVGIAAVLVIWNFAYTLITRVPEEKLMEVYLVNDYIEDPNKLDQLGNQALKYFPELQQITFDDIPLAISANTMPKDEGDLAWQQKLTVVIGAQQGDLFVFSKESFDAFAKQGLFIDLDKYIADGTLKIDSSKAYKASVSIEGQPSSGSKVYGISVDGNALLESVGYNTKDKVLGIPAYSKKIPLALRMVNWLLNNGQIPSK